MVYGIGMALLMQSIIAAGARRQLAFTSPLSTLRSHSSCMTTRNARSGVRRASSNFKSSASSPLKAVAASAVEELAVPEVAEKSKAVEKAIKRQKKSKAVKKPLFNTFHYDDRKHPDLILPPVSDKDKGKICLVLDLDHTLVHSDMPNGSDEADNILRVETKEVG
jgi:TFIIF-interacting CTD phosphatase-like protein